MANKTVAGFGDTSMNGTYIEDGTRNGYAYYYKGDTCALIYFPQFMPYSYSTGYYLVKIMELTGSIGVTTPKYKVEGTDPTATGWVTLCNKDSGEQQVGIVT